jgi:BlaI family transcriptional regulator, penicillinase repressor
MSVVKRSIRVLGLQELQIMNLVWDRGRVTVRDVYEALRARRQVAYTTVMTMMNILDQKGFLKRVPGQDRAFVYEPARSRQTVMRAMVNEFLDRVFGGSANPLMLHLIEDKHVTAKDLDELRRAIRKKGGAS